ncbi:DNA-directed RNA polymerase III subunit RPC4-like [Haliotis rufescens]|uniref:DNA-directed RNA polymerase III subunit RPC4-like n=1 Tax=Haliotis rufescens TaxID=6454 RepID=UPI001EB09DB6|nr:DNA-directed RNA polymerase III subunit RPC4-like [Haliotis rufescens]XP_046352763.1 DNA-directed RNA polymerase III subunit RPC4-like [Haliotis rufescens]
MSDDSKNQGLPRGLIGRRGAPTGKAARLPSLRGPRDLTLGGVPKKVFTPNIPSRRDKPKEDDSGGAPPKPQSATKESGRSRGRGGRERGRGRGRGHENVIQSQSIFEQGPADRLVPKVGGSSWDNGDRVSTSRMSLKKEKSDKNSSKRVLDQILRDDFIDTENLDDDDPNLIPVMLPLSAAGAMVAKKEVKEEERKEVKDTVDGIKVEPGTEMEVDNPDEEKAAEKAKPTAADVSMVKMEHPVFTCKDLLSKCSNSEEDRLLFFQLPDVLPGLPPGRDEVAKTKVKTEPGTEGKKEESKSEEDKLSSQIKTCSLSDFSEGFIGKLQIRKSGRAELVLGNVTLDVSVGTPCGFLQDLVSVRVEGNSGHMTTLGHVRDRLICTPNFETLLKYS